MCSEALSSKTAQDPRADHSKPAAEEAPTGAVSNATEAGEALRNALSFLRAVYDKAMVPAEGNVAADDPATLALARGARLAMATAVQLLATAVHEDAGFAELPEDVGFEPSALQADDASTWPASMRRHYEEDLAERDEALAELRDGDPDTSACGVVHAALQALVEDQLGPEADYCRCLCYHLLDRLPRTSALHALVLHIENTVETIVGATLDVATKHLERAWDIVDGRSALELYRLLKGWPDQGAASCPAGAGAITEAAGGQVDLGSAAVTARYALTLLRRGMANADPETQLRLQFAETMLRAGAANIEAAGEPDGAGIFAPYDKATWAGMGSKDPADWPPALRTLYLEEKARHDAELAIDLEQGENLTDWPYNVLWAEAVQAADPYLGRVRALLRLLDKGLDRESLAWHLVQQADSDTWRIVSEIVTRLQVVAPRVTRLLPYTNGRELYDALQRDLRHNPPDGDAEM